MGLLNRMYGSKKAEYKGAEKSPSRVSGGLKAQGVDRVTMLGENGQESELPTLRYVAALEQQVREQRGSINVLERKLARLESEVQRLTGVVNSGKL